jgi:7,8-dihydropterin-6-yl-methyl-4-(beta-D-ribofuranosyl)aminobenzene 5'-phosphate synthase
MRMRSGLLVVALAAIPAVLPAASPCAEADLLAASTEAFEGWVLRVDCGVPRDSGACLPDPAGTSFEPEMVADCTAVVEVVLVLKGSRQPGDRVEVPFLQLVDVCQGGIPPVDPTPTLALRQFAKIRWYDTAACPGENAIELERPAIRGDAGEDGEVDLTDAIRLLGGLFAGGPWPLSPVAADANGDGSADIADPIYLLQYLFAGGPRPPAPFPEEPAAVLSIAFDGSVYRSEWGFSCWIEAGKARVLVDAGPDGAKTLANLAAMAIDPAAAGAVVFTHLHEDHTGGGPDVLKAMGTFPSVFLPASFATTYPSYRAKVSPFATELVDVSGPREICPGILTTGELAGNPKEQVVLIPAAGGVAVVVACAHPGIAAVVKAAKAQTGKEVVLLLGGYHLFQTAEAEVRAVIAELRSLGGRKGAPCHCTGDAAIALLEEEYGDGFIRIGSGARVAVP